jgi:hypothetical protein
MMNKIIHKHSSVITENGKAKLPTADQLDFGELAVNFAAGVETISLENKEHKIVEFKPSYYTRRLIALNAISTATALNGLNDRVSVVEEEGISNIITNSIDEINKDVQTLSQKINDTYNKISDQFDTIFLDIENNALVVETLVADLNKRMTVMENEPELIITSAKITDTVANASDITADASGVIQAKAVYEYSVSRAEIEEMEYVLTLFLTELDDRVKTLANMLGVE